MTELFDNHYINIVENSPGVSPSELGNPFNQEKDEKTVTDITDTLKSIKAILALHKSMKILRIKTKLLSK